MRGTIAFERLNCETRKGNSVNVRILLNDAVYRMCFLQTLKQVAL
jgi:acid phosphatase